MASPCSVSRNGYWSNGLDSRAAFIEGKSAPMAPPPLRHVRCGDGTGSTGSLRQPSGRRCASVRQAIIGCLLLLLRHRIGAAWVVLRGALQHGHRARVVARATIRCRRIVAIELATCRSGRTGSASGWTILGNLRRRELLGVVAGG